MRKRIVVAVLTAALTCLLLMGAAAPAKPLDLVGNWEEKDKGDSYQAGYIKEGKDGKDGEIVIYWVSDGGDTKSLYWLELMLRQKIIKKLTVGLQRTTKIRQTTLCWHPVTTQRFLPMKKVKLLTRHLL